MKSKYPNTYYATCFLLINVALLLLKLFLYPKALRHFDAIIITSLIVGLAQAALVWNRIWWIKWVMLFFLCSGTIKYIINQTWTKETLLNGIITAVMFLFTAAAISLLIKEPKEG